MSKIVHMVGDEDGAKLAEGEVPSVRTRCGRTIDHPVVTEVVFDTAKVGPRYGLVARNGNQFFCTTRKLFVTCVKCTKNLTTEMTNAPRQTRPAIAQKRAVAHAHAAPARTARAHTRPA